MAIQIFGFCLHLRRYNQSLILSLSKSLRSPTTIQLVMQKAFSQSSYDSAVNHYAKLFFSFRDILKGIIDTPFSNENDFYILSLWMNPKGVELLMKIISTNYERDFSNREANLFVKKQEKSFHLIEERNSLMNSNSNSNFNDDHDDGDVKLEHLEQHNSRSNLNFQVEKQEKVYDHVKKGQSEASHQNEKLQFFFENDSKSHQKNKDSDMMSQSDVDGSKLYKRGPYKNYSVQEKERAVNMLTVQHRSVIEVSRRLGIPCKNIKRWSEQGCMRKKGGGRKKFNPQTEFNVTQYLKSKYPSGSTILYTEVQATAIRLSDDQNFKASRGWVVKYVQRQNLKAIYQFV